MEDVRIGAATRRRPPSRPPFFVGKDVFVMSPVERMVAAGMSRECASETESWYMTQGDEDGLESYIIALEALAGMGNGHAV